MLDKLFVMRKSHRRVYTSYRRPDAEGGEGGAGRKRKAPTARDDPPQPEKKRKARDPATVRAAKILAQ